MRFEALTPVIYKAPRSQLMELMDVWMSMKRVMRGEPCPKAEP